MRLILGYLGLYLIITFGSMFIASITKKKIESAIAIEFGINILLLYLFGIINLLQIGIYIVIILNIICGIIAMIREKKNIKQIVFTPGFAFFSICYFVLMITTFQKQLTDWDHFTYRSLNTKIMYYTNTMMSGYDRFYPPASTLLEYFFMKIIGTYIQGVEAFAIQLFGISLLLPFYENVKKSRLVKFCIGFTIVCIPAVFHNLLFYETAYVDATLGLLLGYIIYIFCTEECVRYKRLSIIIATSLLVLTKPIGIGIAIIEIIMLILFEILKNREKIKSGLKKCLKSQEVRTIIIIILTVIVVFVSWKAIQKIYIERNHKGFVAQDSVRVNGQPIKYVTDSILSTTFGKYQDDLDAADSNGDLIRVLQKVTAIQTPISISLIGTSAIFIFIYAFYYYKTRNKEFKYQFIVIIIGLMLYIILLQLSYLTKFARFEMLGHNGIDRYYPTYLLAMLIFIVGILLKHFNENKSDKIKYVILLIAIVAITPLQSIANVTITSGIYNIDSIMYINNAKNITDVIDEYIEDESEVITINQGYKKQLYNIMIRYYLYPKHNVLVLNDIEKEEIVKKTLENEKYSYIYIYTKNEQLEEIFENVFNNSPIIEDNTLYKIERKDEEINLLKQMYIIPNE